MLPSRRAASSSCRRWAPFEPLFPSPSVCGRAGPSQGTALELLVALAGDMLDCPACALRSDAALWSMLQQAMVRACVGDCCPSLGVVRAAVMGAIRCG